LNSSQFRTTLADSIRTLASPFTCVLTFGALSSCLRSLLTQITSFTSSRLRNRTTPLTICLRSSISLKKLSARTPGRSSISYTRASIRFDFFQFYDEQEKERREKFFFVLFFVLFLFCLLDFARGQVWLPSNQAWQVSCSSSD